MYVGQGCISFDTIQAFALAMDKSWSPGVRGVSGDTLAAQFLFIPLLRTSLMM